MPAQLPELTVADLKEFRDRLYLDIPDGARAGPSVPGSRPATPPTAEQDHAQRWNECRRAAPDEPELGS